MDMWLLFTMDDEPRALLAILLRFISDPAAETAAAVASIDATVSASLAAVAVGC